VYLESDDLMEARVFFAEPNRKEAVLAALSAFPSIVARQTHVVCRRQIENPTADELRAVLDAIVGIPRAFG